MAVFQLRRRDVDHLKESMPEKEKVGVIIPAAGRGIRAGGTERKQFLELRGKPVIVHTIGRFQECDRIDTILVAVEPSYREKMLQLVHEYGLDKVSKVVDGGAERQDSVRNCLDALKKSPVDIVLIHDAVRPFVARGIIVSVIEAAKISGAAVACVRVKDTIKIGDKSRVIRETPAREDLWIAQTPQAFAFDLLVRAFEEASAANFRGTDDSSLVERTGTDVRIIEGDYGNIKITTPDDIRIADYIAGLQAPAPEDY